jgi:prevent-host-death family protein
MEEVTAYQAKTHLSRLLREVALGKQLRITRKGTPVAMLLPVQKEESKNIRKTIVDLKRFRKGIFLKGLSLKKMIEEGRRF